MLQAASVIQTAQAATLRASSEASAEAARVGTALAASRRELASYAADVQAQLTSAEESHASVSALLTHVARYSVVLLDAQAYVARCVAT